MFEFFFLKNDAKWNQTETPMKTKVGVKFGVHVQQKLIGVASIVIVL